MARRVIRRRDIGIHSNAGRLRKVRFILFVDGFERREWLHMKNQAGWGRLRAGKASLVAWGVVAAGVAAVCGFAGVGMVRAQEAPGAQHVGMASGEQHQAQYDAQHRIITAGGFVKTGPVVFQDIAKAAGLTSWHHTSGTPDKPYIVEAKGPGVCLIDYDNDGWLDIYFVNGSTLDAMNGKAAAPHAALFHNNHDGTFTDVTEKAGVANERWGYGCAVADYDNDGWPDLYVTNYGKNRLYRNNHDGTFTDVAEKAGVALGTWSTGATFGDYDGNGRLDLFVAGYLSLIHI